MKKKVFLRIILAILVIVIVLPLLYLAYDRIIMPPAPNWQIPQSYGNFSWEQSAKNYLASYSGDNALRDYLKAYSQIDNHKRTKEWNVMDESVVKDRILDSSAIDKILVTYQDAIEDTLQGAKMQNCELPPFTYSFASPVPDYLRMQILTKFIILKGLTLENENKYGEALDCYLAGLQFGKDIGQKDQPLISRLVSIAVITKNLKPIARLINENKLSESEYRKIIEDTKRIEKEQANMWDAIEMEYRMAYTEFYRKKPIEIALILNGPFGRKPNLGDRLVASYIFLNRGHILRSTKEFYSGIISDMKDHPFPKYIEISKNRGLPKNPLLKMTIPNFTGAVVREDIEINKLRLARINAALRLYQLKKNQWPSSLDELKPDYLTEIPKDVFSDMPFHWTMTSEGFVVYSVGPDTTDNSLQNLYDPTNGTMSKGDFAI